MKANNAITGGIGIWLIATAGVISLCQTTQQMLVVGGASIAILGLGLTQIGRFMRWARKERLVMADMKDGELDPVAQRAELAARDFASIRRGIWCLVVILAGILLRLLLMK